MHKDNVNSDSFIVVLLMGASGCGKSTIGAALANTLGWSFIDCDDLHPQDNIAKMSAGIALNDQDRRTWLSDLHNVMKAHIISKKPLVTTCSALKIDYRDQLFKGIDEKVLLVFLRGSYQLILKRLACRQRHYMKADLLPSQFADLEEPTNEERMVDVDITQSPESIVKQLYEIIANAA